MTRASASAGDSTDRPALDALADALITRHLTAFTRTEFLRAARALSTRYVERRHELSSRPAVDSAGKRAAFAVLYGPIHYAITRAIVERIGGSLPRARTVVDFGCGTGAASAGWASAALEPPVLAGIDRNSWAVAEAGWTWSQLGLAGRARRGDLVAEAGRLGRRSPTALRDTALLLAWSVNELPDAQRDQLLGHLTAVHRLGAAVLVIEPRSGLAVPWWSRWAEAFSAAGGRADTWDLPNALPEPIRRLDREAGFDRQALQARSLTLLA